MWLDPPNIHIINTEYQEPNTRTLAIPFSATSTMNQELPPPDDYDNPAPKPGEGCALAGCDKTEELNRCSACKVFLYCTREHQGEDRPAHKTTCNEIKKARANVEKQKQALIDDPEFRNDNPFENHVGRFWKLRETRPYMMSLSSESLLQRH